MPDATNPHDGTRVYFEDGGGTGAAVVLYGGILDSVELVRRSPIAGALQALPDEFRLVYADHRGLGDSDKPRDVDAYAMPLQVADAVAVLDELDLERAHFVGASYGGRLCFGIGEHAPTRTLSLVAGGQQPYAIDETGPLARAMHGVLDRTRSDGIHVFVEALEAYWDTRFPEPERTGYLAQDGAAVAAAAESLLTQGDISPDLTTWTVPCLAYLGSGDVDFVDGGTESGRRDPGHGAHHHGRPRPPRHALPLRAGRARGAPIPARTHARAELSFVRPA